MNYFELFPSSPFSISCSHHVFEWEGSAAVKGLCIHCVGHPVSRQDTSFTEGNFSFG